MQQYLERPIEYDTYVLGIYPHRKK